MIKGEKCMDKCKCYEETWEIIGWLGPDEVIRKHRHRCNGTRERDECSCGGDRTKCDFYPEVREKAKKEESSIKLNEIGKIKDELRYYLDTNEENGVVYIPKFIIEKIVYGK
jgi:hypothetical protein